MSIIQKRMLRLMAAALILVPLSCGNKDYKVKGDSVVIPLQSVKADGPSQVRLQVLGEKLVRISATPDKVFHDRNSLVVLPQGGSTPFTVESSDGVVKVSTSQVSVSLDKATGKLSFKDSDGKELLSSGKGGKMAFSPIEVEGKKAYSTTVVFDSPDDEAFYGLGQESSTTRGSMRNSISTTPRSASLS